MLVFAEFMLEINGKDAAQDVREKVAQIRDDLPDDIKEPIIATFDPSSEPILSLTVSGERPLRDITDIRPWLQDQLARQKIALIVLEGLGAKDFPVLHALCRNGRSWFNYEPGEGQYLTLASGRHQLFTYPAGYPLYEDDGEDKAYPFSGYFKQIPPDTIGSAFEGRSIAVGNRSMLTHMVFGGDVCIECFARNLFNQGCMAAVHRHDKLQPQSSANP